jgi:orotate phosphoribosyltransferase
VSPGNGAEAPRERERLRELLLELSVQRGQFVLSSGKTSSYYIDCRRTTLHPEGAWLVARSVLDTIASQRIEAEAIGGLTLGADPIAAAVAAMSYELGRPLPAFIVRKQEKDHGTRKRIEGFDVSGRRVLVVDDVVTTGDSTVEAIRAVEEASGSVSAVVCILDREEGGAGRFKGIPFYPLFTRTALLGE